MNILLGLTGSVATIVADKVVAALRAFGTVRVIASDKAEYFLRNVPVLGAEKIGEDAEWPPTFQKGDPVTHIELRKWADAMVIAPASANTLAKLSQGACDNLLTSVARAWDFTKPILVAPAMNTFMWNHPVTRVHLQTLRSFGYGVIDPVCKVLACGDEGMGAMAAPETIASEVARALAMRGGAA